MDDWIFYASSDSGPAYFVSTSRPRFVVELELDEDGSWRGREIWGIDTVSADDVERLLCELGMCS